MTYSGTSLIWTPLGPFQVSTLWRCPDFLCKCSIWDHNKCPEYGGVLISEVQISEVPLYHHSTAVFHGSSCRYLLWSDYLNTIQVKSVQASRQDRVALPPGGRERVLSLMLFKIHPLELIAYMHIHKQVQ